MRELALHLLQPIVDHPDEVSIQIVEGESATILEAVVHPDDRARLEEDGGRTLRAMRNIISAAAGRRKATLDIVEAHAEAADDDEE